MYQQLNRIAVLGLLLILGGIAASLAPSSPVAVHAQEVPSEAEVVSTSTPADIECVWALPDMAPNLIDDGATFPDDDIQYADAAGNHDDGPARPDASALRPDGGVVPCAGPPVSLANQPDDVMNMIQVLPVAHNPIDPNVPTRFVQLWMAADHPNGNGNIDHVFFRVYEPTHGATGAVTSIADTQFKIDVAAEADDGGGRIGEGAISTGERLQACADLGSSSQAGSMFNAAVESGQLSAAAVDDNNFGMVAKCQQDEKSIYFARFEIDKDQSCGKYLVEGVAVSNGAQSVKTMWIDVICSVSISLDFESVNWGAITPGQPDKVSGNFIFSPGDGAPTVHNGLSGGLGVSVLFHNLEQQGVQVGEDIDDFDACFLKQPAQGQVSLADLLCVGEDPANPIVGWDGVGDPPAPVQLGDTAPQVLCANEVGKLDLSIHPDRSIPAGSYAGRVEVIARHVPQICPKDRGS